jgi:hypothetical protein
VLAAIGDLAAAPRQIDWTLRLRRAGPVRVGMSLPEVRDALGDSRAAIAGGDPDAPCAYLSSPAIPAALGFMFDRGRLVRIDVDAPGIRTASGVAVGSTEEAVRRAYGDRIRVEPHKYEPGGHNLRYVTRDASDRGFGMIFETDGRRVTRFRTGTVAAVALVERCG